MGSPSTTALWTAAWTPSAMSHSGSVVAGLSGSWANPVAASLPWPAAYSAHCLPTEKSCKGVSHSAARDHGAVTRVGAAAMEGAVVCSAGGDSVARSALPRGAPGRGNLRASRATKPSSCMGKGCADAARARPAGDRFRDVPARIERGHAPACGNRFGAGFAPAGPYCGRATTALDTLVQHQVFECFNAMRREIGTALILITHDSDWSPTIVTTS